MQRFLFIWMCLWPFMLLRGTPFEYQEPKEVATTEGLPSSLVNQSVCVISGEYTDSVQDVVLPGPEPFIIQRFYGNKSQGSVGHGWSFNHFEKLILGDAIYDQKQSVWIIALRQPSGAQLDYIYPKSKEAVKKKDLQFELLLPKGLTNGATTLSGRTNIKNQEVHFYPDADKIISISGAGHRRTFAKIGRTEDGWNICGQQKEEKVNGSVYQYEGKGKNWDSRILCQSRKTHQLYSSIKFIHKELNEQNPLVMTTNDGRQFKYYFKRHKYKEKEGDGNNQTIHHVTRFYLSKVEHPYAPIERYEYGEKASSQELQMICKRRPDGRFLQTEYYHKGKNGVGGTVGDIEIKNADDYCLNRVKKQKAPVGTTEKPMTTHRFVYHCKVKKNKKEDFEELLEGTTDVYDAYHHRTQYAYDEDHRLTSIIRYRGTSSYLPYCSESFVWGKKGGQKGNLLGKIFRDEAGNVHHARYFVYDKRGNVLTSLLCGKLTGLPSPAIVLNDAEQPIENGYECERKTYTYSDDGLNLVLSETDSRGKNVTYHYLPGTDQVCAKYVMYERQIQLREFFFYDDHYVVTQKITDDGKALSCEDLTGVTERHFVDITPTDSFPLGQPQRLEESYLDFASGQKKLLRSFHFSYSKEGRLLKKDVFDANGQWVYALKRKYDDHGNVTQETNALNEVTTKQYDANDNLIFQESANCSMQNTYDFANRLIQQEEMHADGQHFVITHTYDYLGNCIATVDPYGHETRQIFDDFGRVVSIQYPAISDEAGHLVQPTIAKTYDIAGFPICLIDAKGGKTQMECNIRGQPTRIVYSDGSSEQWIYHLDGQVTQKIAKNGLRTVCQRDPFGRVTEEAVYDADGQLLKKTQHLYNALHLLQSIDAEGRVTSYSYDGAGRLEWTFQGDQKQQNLYDSLGRLVEIREWFGNQPHEYRATIKLYDLLDRVIEERLQSSDGIILHLSRYAYDCRGNRTLCQRGEEKTWTEYDAHNNPIQITNGLGQVTHIVYNTQFINSHGQRVLQTLTTDPLGYQTIDIYDTANRLVETIRQNPFGLKVGRQAIFYDLCGNKIRVLDEVIQEKEHKRTVETRYTYSEDHQVTALIEAFGAPEQKITRTLYNQYRQKSATIKPDGMTIFYDYDSLGRLKTLKSADGLVSYLYEYNLSDQVTRVIDLHGNHVTERMYDPVGQLIKETLGNGLSLHYTYDRTGRVRTALFPDQTGVEYLYDAVDLKEIHRVIGGKRVYSHFDQSHTLAGQVAKAQLSGNNGTIEYTYNAIGHCTKIASNAFQQIVPSDGFDAAGNLVKFQSQGISYQFAYDDHYQIQSEEGHVQHAYQFDSLFNRVAKDGEGYVHNALNQILQKDKEQFVYDANGNLIERIQGTKKICYAYDPLDRLIRVDQDGKSTHYVYDSFHRRLIKRQEGLEDQLFVYQGQEEIGKWLGGAFQELCLLGKNKRNPMVALELKGVPYVPLHDLSGHVVCLLDHQGKVVERYRYTIFGESEIFNSEGEKGLVSVVGNPWQYASKRLDEETGLVAFGLRYYDPSLGRWITPDPAGFVDGPNLYAYVHNSSLLYWDQFGLYKSWGLTGVCGHLIFDALHQMNCTAYSTFQEFGKFVLGKGEPGIINMAIEDKLEAEYHFRSDSKQSFEKTATFSLNDGAILNPSTNRPFQLKQSANKGLGFINGICNTRSDFEESLAYLGQMSEYNIKGVHSASFGMLRDALCYLNAIRNYVAYEGVRELHKMWQEFFQNAPIDATFLMICHSRGAVYVRNALMSFPADLSKRIEVIAIAPGGYIDPGLCKSVKHYVSEADVIPLFDLVGHERCKHTIVTLERHSKASRFFDHSFNSPTYTEALQRRIDKYNMR